MQQKPPDKFNRCYSAEHSLLGIAIFVLKGNHPTETRGVDQDKKHLIQRIAKEYLETGRAKQIAKKNGMNYPNLSKILEFITGISKNDTKSLQKGKVF